MITRRKLVTITPAMVAAAVLANCSPSQAQSDAELIATDLAPILTDIESIPGVNLSDTNKSLISTALSKIGELAPKIGSVVDPTNTTAQTFLKAVTTIGGIVIPLLTGNPAMIASLVLAAVQGAVVLAQGLAASGTTTASAMPGQMAPVQARAALATYAAGRRAGK